ILDVPITSTAQKQAIPLQQVAQVESAHVPTQINHTNLQPTIDLTMGVHGRDLGHVADDVAAVVNRFGVAKGRGAWTPYDPNAKEKKLLAGSTITLSGEYSRMQDTFRNLGIGLLLATLLIYFLMVALFKSWLAPLVVLS